MNYRYTYFQYGPQGQASGPTARILSRKEARQTYDSIVSKLRDPALLEFAGHNLIRSSVFPLPAGGTQRIRLTYEHVLEANGNRIDYVLPRSESLDRGGVWGAGGIHKWRGGSLAPRRDRPHLHCGCTALRRYRGLRRQVYGRSS